MDEENVYYLSYFQIPDGKAKSIFVYGDGFDEIEDPWYSGRYALVVDQLEVCLMQYLKDLLANNLI